MKKAFIFKGLWFFYVSLVLMAMAIFFDADKAFSAFEKSYSMLIKLIPVFVLVILFTALMSYFIKPKTIMKHFGAKNTLKGWGIAIFGGILSHGPMYAWYGMFEELKKHGLSDGMIATFFYARAIKLPLLPIMIDYFGLMFTVIFNVYILIFAFLQGIIINNIKVKG